MTDFLLVFIAVMQVVQLWFLISIWSRPRSGDSAGKEGE